MSQRHATAVETASTNVTKSASTGSFNPVRGGGLRVLLRREFIRLLGAVAAIVLFSIARAQTKNPTPVSYKKQIAPIFAANCNACHGGAMPQSGLDTTTFARLMKGGKLGKPLIPGKGKESLLVQYLDGRKMPRMPIGSALKPAQIALITRWIDEGAKVDGEGAAAAATKPIKAPSDVLPQAAALAWSRDGTRLAVGTYQKVELFDTTTGKRVLTLPGHADVVRSLAFHPTTNLLAAAGGIPGQGGEIFLWDMDGIDPKSKIQSLSRAQPRDPKSKMSGHADCIYGIAWRPDGQQIVSASYDKTLKLWDPATGKPIADLKDHADAVYACGYHPNGKFLATGSADRSVRIWDPAKGTRIYTLAGHTEGVTALAFHPVAEQLVTAGADRAPKLWNLKADSGENTRTFTAQTDVITDLRFAPGGAVFATACNDGKVCIFDPSKNDPVRTIQASTDAVLALAFSPDGKKLAIGCYDGSVRVLELPEGKVALRMIEPPGAKSARR